MRVVLLGLGQVGLSLLEIVQRKFFPATGEQFNVVAAADSSGVLDAGRGIRPIDLLSAKRSGDLHSLPGWHSGMDAREAVGLAEADVLIDCMTTNFRNGQPSIDCILNGTKRGMDIVTANKGPLALSMGEVLSSAARHSVSVRFGATVGGGTPFLDFGRMLKSTSEIVSMKGVLNGTTNYVLTRMGEGMKLEAAVAEAKAAGIAETDPSNDLLGLDSAAKITILANSLCGTEFKMSDVEITGIDSIGAPMLAAAVKEGKMLKLISTYSSEERILSVRPEMVSSDNHLNVSGAYNALTYRTGSGNEYTVIGTGAGAPETANAVLRDLLSLPRIRPR